MSFNNEIMVNSVQPTIDAMTTLESKKICRTILAHICPSIPGSCRASVAQVQETPNFEATGFL